MDVPTPCFEARDHAGERPGLPNASLDMTHLLKKTQGFRAPEKARTYD
jgi:hypothetical protein